MSKRRKTVWVGGGQLITPEPDVSTSTGEIIELVPAVLAATEPGADTQCTVEAIYLHFSIRRNTVNITDALGFLVWVANVTEVADVPVQALDALSITSRAYGNKNILMMAPLPVPPLLGASDLLSFVTNDQVVTDHHEFQASRKLDRSNNVLAMSVNVETLSVIVFCQWRVLLDYGAK